MANGYAGRRVYEISLASVGGGVTEVALPRQRDQRRPGSGPVAPHLAARAGMSERTFSRAFQKRVRTTPGEYRQRFGRRHAADAPG